MLRRKGPHPKPEILKKNTSTPKPKSLHPKLLHPSKHLPKKGESVTKLSVGDHLTTMPSLVFCLLRHLSRLLLERSSLRLLVLQLPLLVLQPQPLLLVLSLLLLQLPLLVLQQQPLLLVLSLLLLQLPLLVLQQQPLLLVLSLLLLYLPLLVLQQRQRRGP